MYVPVWLLRIVTEELITVRRIHKQEAKGKEPIYNRCHGCVDEENHEVEDVVRSNLWMLEIKRIVQRPKKAENSSLPLLFGKVGEERQSSAECLGKGRNF